MDKSKKQCVRVAKQNQLLLHPDALDVLHTTLMNTFGGLENVDEEEEVLLQQVEANRSAFLMKAFTTMRELKLLQSGRHVTGTAATQACEHCLRVSGFSGSGGSAGAGGNHGRQRHSGFQVVSQFPTFGVDESHGSVTVPRKGKLLRMSCLSQRYFLCRERCYRSGLYKRPQSTSLHSSGNNPSSSSLLMSSATAATTDGLNSKKFLLPISSLDGLDPKAMVSVMGLLKRRTVLSAPTATAPSNIHMMGKQRLFNTLGDFGMSLTEEEEAELASGWCIEDPYNTLNIDLRPVLETAVNLRTSQEQAKREKEKEQQQDPSSSTPSNTTLSSLEDIIGSGGIIAEGMMVVVVGTWKTSGIFSCCYILLPPAEPQQRTVAAVQNQDLFGDAPHDVNLAREQEINALEKVLIVMSHIHLDKPSTISQLAKFFTEFESRGEEELSNLMFVLVGEFASSPQPLGDLSHTNGDDDVTLWSAYFSQLMETFVTAVSTAGPKTCQFSSFVFVPGANDPTIISGVMPQPPLPAMFEKILKKKLKDVTVARNPCRIRFCTQEIVICRQDAIHQFRSAQKPPFHTVLSRYQDSRKGDDHDQEEEDSNSYADDSVKSRVGNREPFMKICTSLLSQAHLLPTFSSRSIPLWDCDEHLRLFPLPTLLVLCDRSEQWEVSVGGPEGRHNVTLGDGVSDFVPSSTGTAATTIVNPGSFSASGSFLWYTPADKSYTVNSMMQ